MKAPKSPKTFKPMRILKPGLHKYGPPRLPIWKAKAVTLRVRVTLDERAAIEIAARANNQTVAEWIRCALATVLRG